MTGALRDPVENSLLRRSKTVAVDGEVEQSVLAVVPQAQVLQGREAVSLVIVARAPSRVRWQIEVPLESSIRALVHVGVVALLNSWQGSRRHGEDGKGSGGAMR